VSVPGTLCRPTLTVLTQLVDFWNGCIGGGLEGGYEQGTAWEALTLALDHEGRGYRCPRCTRVDL